MNLIYVLFWEIPNLIFICLKTMFTYFHDKWNDLRYIFIVNLACSYKKCTKFKKRFE